MSEGEVSLNSEEPLGLVSCLLLFYKIKSLIIFLYWPNLVIKVSEVEGNQTVKEDEEHTINLPVGYIYSNFSDVVANEIHFYCNELKTDEEIQHWVKEFGEQNFVEWRIARTHPNLAGVKCCYRIDYRCQHSSTWYQTLASNIKRKIKSMQCPSKLIIKRIQKSRYDYYGEVCTVISLRSQHNHPTGTPSTLKYRDVSERTKQRLIKLLKNGHSPSSAQQALHSEAMLKFGEDYDSVGADRNKVPDLSYCYNIFYKVLKNDDNSPREEVQIKSDKNTEIDGTAGLTEEKTSKILDNVDIKDGVLDRTGIQDDDLDSTDVQDGDIQIEECPLQPNEADAVTASLKNAFDDILQRVQNSQSWGLIKASEAFCKNYNMLCKGDISLRLAMSKFGKLGSRQKLTTSIPKASSVRRKNNITKSHSLSSKKKLKTFSKNEIVRSTAGSDNRPPE